MEIGFWISVVVLLVGIFASWSINSHYTRKTIERMDKRARETEQSMAKAIAPLAEVTASIKTEVKSLGRKGPKRQRS